MKVLICIPTLTGREIYLENALRGYRTYDGGHEIVVSLVRDAPSCGVGWQMCAERGLDEHPDIEFLAFGNDDVVPGHNWLNPLIRMAFRGSCIPAPRIEPAGAHVGQQEIADAVMAGVSPPMPPPGDPKSSGGFFYAELAELQPTKSYQPIDHTAFPSCTIAQWGEVQPFPPFHYGTDKIFCHRARKRGWPTLACQESIIFNYAASHGRSKGDWQEIDFLDFDLTIAYPMYESGALKLTEQHPLRLTPEGLRLVRRWRADSFPGEHHFDRETLETKT